MKVSFIDGQPITLEQMLIAKEQRVERQIKAIQQYKLPVISLTLVIPGAVKKSSATDYIFEEAISTLHQYLLHHQITQIKEEYYHLATGSEAIIVVDCLSHELKKHCINIEENHLLGRLWDIDIIDPNTKTSISRTEFSHKPRLCLVCQENAKVCSRSRRHSIDEIFNSITQLISCHLNMSLSIKAQVD